MDFSQQQQSSRRMVGFGIVVLLHILIAWALVSGLARKVVEVVKGPIEVKVIEEVVKKPPPPPEVLPPPPKMAAPPPPFIPPPEVNIAPPPTPAPTITAVTPQAPPGPQAPVITKAPPGPPTPPAPSPRSVGVVCPNYKAAIQQSLVYPREALLDGIQGQVVLTFTVTASGQVKDVAIKSSSNRVFNRAALAAVRQVSCAGQGQDVVGVELPIDFTIN
jgi:protein TonB